jgi:hypothetical protein
MGKESERLNNIGGRLPRLTAGDYFESACGFAKVFAAPGTVSINVVSFHFPVKLACSA